MDIGNLIELRIHGVSGTPPEELLDRPLVDLVAGDRTAGFYRSHLVAERTDDVPALDGEPPTVGPLLEGYAWGGLTSGAPSRAFWLLLLPFTLVNVAPRMRPAESQVGRAVLRTRLIWYLCRLLGLSLTVLLVAGFAGVGDDLIAWQCKANQAACSTATPKGMMRWIAAKSIHDRMGIGTLLPLVALGFLWLISGRTIKNYETVTHGLPAAEDSSSGEVGLTSSWMWRNEAPVRRLRAVHVQIGLATILAIASSPLASPWRQLDAAVAAAVGTWCVVAIALPSVTAHREECRWKYGGWTGWSRAVWVLSGGAIALSGGFMVFGSGSIDAGLAACASRSLPSCGLPRFADTVLGVFVVELVVVLALFCTTVWAQHHVDGETQPAASLRGWGTAVFSMIGVFLASVFTAGSYLYAAAWLVNGSAKPGFGAASKVSREFMIPEVVKDAAFAYAISVGILVVSIVVGALGLAAITGWRRLRHSPTTPTALGEEFRNDYPGRALTDRRSTTILRVLGVGRLVDFAGWPLGILVTAGAVVTFIFAGALVAEHAPPHARELGQWLAGTSSHARHGFFSPPSLQGTGAFLAVATLVLIVTLGALAFRVPATRRSVGVLWDLASFWPRLSHPLAAPCYAERTVPDLVERVTWYVRNGTGVVLAGHSQGTVIGSAAVLQLRVTDRQGPAQQQVLPSVGLMTFGCVLRRLYNRFFPAYFGAPTVASIADALGPVSAPPTLPRWRNLWRYSDYLGGPVESGPPSPLEPVWTPSAVDDRIDLHLVDPAYDKRPGDTVYPAPGRHSSFWKVREFQLAIQLMAKLIR